MQQNFWLSPERMLFWEEQQALIVSDLHFGKTGHFRKEGIPVPQSVYKEDLQRLVSQLQFFQPRQLIVVGDMFHSRANKELDWFKKWREDFPALEINLIMGNHDILKRQWYTEAGINIIYHQLLISEFSFMHDINSASDELTLSSYIFSGHIHPGIRISGAGKQSLHFPCFYFTPAFCVLPAFSRFTGLAMVKPAAEDNVFAIVNQTIMQF
ncbi:MAG: ligase-associated DNA damage response endonuclease PdeM [Chitinophagaceae bacterium]